MGATSRVAMSTRLMISISCGLSKMIKRMKGNRIKMIIVVMIEKSKLTKLLQTNKIVRIKILALATTAKVA